MIAPLVGLGGPQKSEQEQKQKHQERTAKSFASLTNQPQEPELKGESTMRQSWDDYEKATEAGPLAIGFKAVLGLAAIGLFAWLVFGACSLVTGTVNETASVAQQQFGARASLAKYEWFKDAAAQLDKKRADLVLYEKRMQRCATPTHADERERCGIWESEMLGIAASYNGLAAEYNSASSKFNWAYAGRAELPHEIAPYNTGVK